MPVNIEFNQQELLKRTLPPRLETLAKRYDGLCELICNRILMKDLLGKGDAQYLKEKLTPAKLNKDKVARSHMLHVYSLIQKIVAFLFRVYPDNIFSYRDQLRLVNKSFINHMVLFKKLDELETGTTVKVELFTRKFLTFYGHSTLIKKVAHNEFIFFDPNDGEHHHLFKYSLAELIEKRMRLHGANDLFFVKGSCYLKRLKR
ncbi:MAG: hypothetical protein JSR37_09835 [Verrucomicrobia bacterium]|nr:hypothetical protein [Verrucomicrobiota bacterium]MBS0637434.1 hypothetical protein [Verrucomicrobiota bacterium]